MLRLMKKVIIVTGGANGIGRLYSAHLCGEGAQVVVADVDEHAAQVVAEGLNRTFHREVAVACTTDVTSEADTSMMAETALERFGRIDVLLNNAGTYPHVEFDDIDYPAWRKVITTNLDSMFLCAKAVVPTMKRQGGGKIINVTTNLVWVGLKGMVHYISAKAGVVGFTRSLARELGEHNITVNAIAPGAVIPEADYTETAKQRVAQIIEAQCIKRAQRKEDLPGVVTFLCSSDADFISGQVISVDGGLTTH